HRFGSFGPHRTSGTPAALSVAHTARTKRADIGCSAPSGGSKTIMASARFALAASLALVAAPLFAPPLVSPAHAEGAQSPAEGSVSVVKGQFTDRVEAGKPVGDSSALKDAAKATYWLDVSNLGKDTVQLTLVWTIDGKEAAKQTLEVGHSPHWRTWGSWSIKN